MVSEAIIIGGGASIQGGISLGLKDYLRDHFVIACNFAFNHFENTFTTFIDPNFYRGILDKEKSVIPNLEHVNKLKSLPLIIGNKFSGEQKDYYPNTIPLQCCGTFSKDIFAKKRGVYTGCMTGIFSLHLAAYLMNYTGTIYLLGFDWSMRKKETVDPHHYTEYAPEIKTHYYNDIPHRGIHRVKYFENHDPNENFKYFMMKGLKIYNVSPNSNISNFEKINYLTFFSLLSDVRYGQNKLRTQIKEKLCI